MMVSHGQRKGNGLTEAVGGMAVGFVDSVVAVTHQRTVTTKPWWRNPG